MKILLLSSAFSGLTQRVLRELQLSGHEVDQHIDLRPEELNTQCSLYNPEVILCTTLFQRIPTAIWQKYLCLVVHPGIEGDRGPSSLDWAIMQGSTQWGVTLLQAAEEMDAGDIWGTRTFAMRSASKTSLYKREVSSCAVELINEALSNIMHGEFVPRELDYANPDVHGELIGAMCQQDRCIDWLREGTQSIIRKFHAADTNPGIEDTLLGQQVRMFGAIREPHLTGVAGQIIATHKGAICRATLDGAIWIRQLKCLNSSKVPAIKLPAAKAIAMLQGESWKCPQHNCDELTAAEDITVTREGQVACVYFDFCNAAVNTEQCNDLRERLISLKNSDVKIIILMGGEDFWCNGIHLNCIEAADDPSQESWLNINAIDDLVREIIDSPEQLTIAALRNNAGAGGAILALACDKVLIREGVVVNPHYQLMGLYGSEYWTYLLPSRVGQLQAKKLMAECQPLLATEAVSIGFADAILSEDWNKYHTELRHYYQMLDQNLDMDDFLSRKIRRRVEDEKTKPLEKYRQEELCEMRKVFADPDSYYHHARRAFVYKSKQMQTPAVSKLLTAEPGSDTTQGQDLRPVSARHRSKAASQQQIRNSPSPSVSRKIIASERSTLEPLNTEEG